jgi:hypothetical protein
VLGVKPRALSMLGKCSITEDITSHNLTSSVISIEHFSHINCFLKQRSLTTERHIYLVFYKKISFT